MDVQLFIGGGSFTEFVAKGVDDVDHQEDLTVVQRSSVVERLQGFAIVGVHRLPVDQCTAVRRGSVQSITVVQQTRRASGGQGGVGMEHVRGVTVSVEIPSRIGRTAEGVASSTIFIQETLIQRVRGEKSAELLFHVLRVAFQATAQRMCPLVICEPRIDIDREIGILVRDPQQTLLREELGERFVSTETSEFVGTGQFAQIGLAQRTDVIIVRDNTEIENVFRFRVRLETEFLPELQPVRGQHQPFAIETGKEIRNGLRTTDLLF